MSEEETRGMIDKIMDTLSSIFVKMTNGQKQDMASIFPILCDLKNLFEQYSEQNVMECGRLVINKYIKMLNFILTIEPNNERKAEYISHLENSYKLAGRVSLEHFIIYYEWEEEDKLLEKRYPILRSYVYYLNKMCFDDTFEGIIANLPSGYRKMY